MPAFGATFSASHPGDTENKRLGRHKGASAVAVTDCVSRHAFPRSALTRQSADGAKNVQPAPNPAESARHYQTAMAVAKRDTNQHLHVQMTTVTVLEVTQSHLTFVSRWNNPL